MQVFGSQFPVNNLLYFISLQALIYQSLQSRNSIGIASTIFAWSRFAKAMTRI